MCFLVPTLYSSLFGNTRFILLSRTLSRAAGWLAPSSYSQGQNRQQAVCDRRPRGPRPARQGGRCSGRTAAAAVDDDVHFRAFRGAFRPRWRSRGGAIRAPSSWRGSARPAPRCAARSRHSHAAAVMVLMTIRGAVRADCTNGVERSPQECGGGAIGPGGSGPGCRLEAFNPFPLLLTRDQRGA